MASRCATGQLSLGPYYEWVGTPVHGLALITAWVKDHFQTLPNGANKQRFSFRFRRYYSNVDDRNRLLVNSVATVAITTSSSRNSYGCNNERRKRNSAGRVNWCPCHKVEGQRTRTTLPMALIAPLTAASMLESTSMLTTSAVLSHCRTAIVASPPFSAMKQRHIAT